MFQQKFYLIGLLSIVVGIGVITPSFGVEMPSEEEKVPTVQSDSGEISPEDILKIDADAEKELAIQTDKNENSETDKQSDLSDTNEKVATITAEGDFIVPTFVLPDVKKEIVEPKTQFLTEEKETKIVRKLPVVKITQTELTPVREQMRVERRLTGKTTKTTELYKEALKRSKGVIPAGGYGDEEKETVEIEKPKKKLLLPLKPLPKEAQPEEDLSGTSPLYKTYSSEMADKALADAQNQDETPLLMPQDIKVTFYPNSAEFSGQTVKWIKVFSMRARNDPRYMVEIRLSNENPYVQQKRLFVIQRILINNGLSLHQIAIDYVNRPENSLILRMVKREQDIQSQKIQMKNGQVKERKTINW